MKFLLKVERTFFFGVLPSKYSGRWRNNADEVLAKLFFGERICQNFGSFVFEFGCRKWKRRGLGRNFPFAPLFVLGEFGADRKQNTNSISILCLYHSTIFRPRSKGDQPRHSPRTFPLGLLAPRCLGFLLILALPLCGAGARAGGCLGGGRNPPPSFGLLLVPSESALAQPPLLVFKIAFVVSLSLRISVLQDNGGAHPLAMDALAEMSEAQMQMRLTHPPVRAQYPRRGETRKRRGCSLLKRNIVRIYFFNLFRYYWLDT